MKVVCAPNAFKESLSSPEICAICTETIGTRAQVVSAPLADGGDGTLEVFRSILAESKILRRSVTSAFENEPTEAPLLWQESTKRAVIELAQVCGLAHVETKRRNPNVTTTRGVGELCSFAFSLGAQHVYIGIGGSATNDAGTGAMRALGWEFLDKRSKPCPEGGLGLAQLERMVPAPPPACAVTVLCDVKNPLCGPQGASHVYGPQKGASESDVVALDGALARFAEVARNTLGVEINVPGSGAAGGFAAGALLGMGAELVSGFETISQLVNLEQHIAECDLVITGEGRLDTQTMHGKAVAGVMNLATRYHKPVALIVGSTELHQPPTGTMVISLVNAETSLAQAIAEPDRVYRKRLERSWGDILKFVEGYAAQLNT
jgi:glycerate kinase